MAENMIKFLRGNVASLPANATPGAVYFTKDEGLYLGLEDGSYHRYGDFITVANVASLPENGAHETCMYYCESENVLAKWNGTTWVQINKQKTLAELGGVAKSVYDAKMSALEKADTDNATAIAGVDTRLQAAEKKLESVATTEGLGELAETVAGHTTAIDTIKGDVNTAGSMLKIAKDAADSKDAAIATAKAAGDNAQAYAEGVATNLSTHTGNGDIHITAEEREAWNGKTTMTEVEAKGYQNAEQVQAIANGKDAAIQAAKDRADAAYTLAEGKATMEQVNSAIAGAGHAVKADVDTALENLGKAYVAADEALETKLQGNIDKKVDQTAYNTKMDALGAEDERLAGLISAIEGDYLKAADKTELQGKIDGVSGRVATIEGDYLKGADKTELEGKIDLKAAQTALDAEVEAREGAIEGLQNQINLIMNNPDTEKVVDSITEFTAWVEEHGTLAEGMRTDIDKNKEDIAAEVKRAGEAESALAGRLDTLENKFTGEGSVEALIATAKQEAIDAAATAADTKDEAILAAAKKYADDEDAKIESRVGELETASVTHATKDELQGVSDALTEYKEAHKNDYDNDAVDAKVQGVQDQIDALGDTYATDDELEAAIAAEVTRANGAYAAKTLESTVDTHINDGDVHVTTEDKEKWNGAQAAAEATAAAALATARTAITAEIATAKGEAISDAEGKIATAKSELQGEIDADVLVETNRAKGVEEGLQSAIDTINNTENGILAQAKSDATSKANAAQAAAEKTASDALTAALTWGSF